MTLDSLLCFDIYAANLAFGRFYKPYLDEMGLTYPQVLVLSALWDTDGLIVGAIGARLGLDSSTLTPILKRLEVSGLLTRRRDHKDERRVIIALTESGRDLQRPVARVMCNVAAATGMDEAQVQQLQQMLVTLRARLASAAAG